MAAQRGQEPLLIGVEALDVERGGELLLAAEVVVDAADARPGALADLLDARAVVAALGEYVKGRVEDRAAAAGGSRGRGSWHRAG